MHEFSIVKSLLTQVSEIQQQYRGAEVVAVRVEIGPLTGVEPALVRLAFEQLASEQTNEPPSLIIEEVPLTCYCSGCEHEFELVEWNFQCVRCGSRGVRVLRGDQFLLVDVTLRDEDSIGDCDNVSAGECRRAM